MRLRSLIPRRAGRISVVRLRVPRKALEPHDHALNAFRKQKLEDAEKEVERALKIYPRFPDALTLCGGIRVARQQWFRASIDTDPTFSPAYIGLADVLNEELRFDDALAAVQRADQLTRGAWNLQYETSRPPR
jgi:tetratricopeptide (TPR) repeat protein